MSSTQLHEQIGKGALDDQQLLAIEGSKNSTGSQDSTSNWTESEKGCKMQRKTDPSSRTARLVKLVKVIFRFPSAN